VLEQKQNIVKYLQMNQRDIINKYPLLFARYYLPMTETCMCWGLQIGKGWYPIIDDLCSKIQKLIDEDVIKKFEFDEIKQKFGSLRINSYQRCKEVEKLIEQAKYRASTTCEECSKTVYYNYDSDDSYSENNSCSETNNYDILCDDCK
jgi:hypothetical protein